MITVGEILQRAREKKKLTVEQVEKATRIRAKFIVALEENKFEKLPGPIFERGFVKNYAVFLGLPSEEVLAFYRRQANHKNPPDVVKEDKRIVGKTLITPQRFTFFSIGILLLIFFGYLIFSYLQFAGSPILVVDSPINNTVFYESVAEVTGKTDQNAKLTINNEQININESGSFIVKVPLQPGLNKITIVATNKFGEKTTVERNIRLEK